MHLLLGVLPIPSGHINWHAPYRVKYQTDPEQRPTRLTLTRLFLETMFDQSDANVRECAELSHCRKHGHTWEARTYPAHLSISRLLDPASASRFYCAVCSRLLVRGAE